MVDIASRKSWGARHDDGDLTLTGLATHVVVHHTTSSLGASGGGTPSIEEERAHMRYLESVGESRFGRGISYNVLVFPSGRAYQGVSFNRRGTHTGGHNSTRRSVSYVGNFENDQPTQAALDTGRAIIAEGRGRWWRKDAPVDGHRDYTSTACPGRHLYAQLDYLRSGKAPAKPGTSLPAPSRLAVDGRLGRETVKALQTELGTVRDGVISSQPMAYRNRMPAVYGGSVQYWPRPRGSVVVAALQRHLGVRPDGLLGPNTIEAWQRKLDVKDDGFFGTASTEALQRALNDGKLW